MTDYFDEAAAIWDNEKYRTERAEAIAKKITSMVPLTKSMKALEFGSGTGLLGFNMIERVGELTFGDTSQGMLDQVEKKIAAHQYGNAKTVNLASSSITSKYDLIFTSMVLHHIEDYEDTIVNLVRSLTPSGYLCLCDLDKENGSFHRNEIVPHNGFERASVETLLQDSGMQIVGSSTAFVNVKIIDNAKVDFPVFLIVATKKCM